MLGLVLIVIASITIAAVTNPAKAGLMYSTNGSGAAGSWAAMTGTGGALYSGSVTPMGVMYSTDGTGNPGTWAPATQASFGTTATEWQNGPKQAVSTAFGQNATRLFSFVMPVNIVNLTKISYNVNTTADNTANLYDFGIYTSTGTLVCHTGPIAGTIAFPANNASVTLTLLSTGCTLNAGTRYLFGITTNAAAAGTMQSIGLGFMAVGNGVPTAGNVTTGGVLNSSITPPADSWVSNSTVPAIALHN
jgi:hypothetical protein